ncbi:hypothetical protein QF011_003584 [Curtobacterium flaccumfaciens]|nr:hypothetical protein [Curtobacterium flaccumfaciens]MDQ0541006.1 hypothetical protein [Curtobacterium flaccumfaciens]
MTENPLVQQSIAAHENRVERERTRAAAHEEEQKGLRAEFIRSKRSLWSANAAFTLFDRNDPDLVDLEWTLPAGTTREWDLVHTGARMIAQSRNPDGTVDKFLVTASIADDVSLALELNTPDLESKYGFLAVMQDMSRNLTQVSSLSELGAAIVTFRSAGAR